MRVREGIGIVLLLLGLLRATLLVMQDPLAGYGDQYDTHRTASCLGLAPDVPAADGGKLHGPYPLYRSERTVKVECYPSTEVAFGAAVLAATGALHVEGKGIRLQWFGLGKLALLFITAILIAWTFHDHPAASIAHGAVMLLVLSDPVVTLWFNTLSTEFFVVWSIYAIIASACALAISDRGAIVMWSLLTLSVIALAFSREQFALLGPVLVAFSAPWLWYRSGPVTGVIFFMAALSAAVAFTVMHPRPPPPDAPPASATFAIPRALPAEPEVFARTAAKAMAAVQPVSVDAPAREANDKARVRDLPWWAFSPIDAGISRVHPAIFPLFLFVTFLLAPITMLMALAWARPASANVGASLLYAILLGTVVLYAYVTAVFGERPAQAARAFLPGQLAMYALWVSLLAGVPFLALRWYAAPNWKEMALGVVAIALLVAGCIYAMPWIDAS